MPAVRAAHSDHAVLDPDAFDTNRWRRRRVASAVTETCAASSGGRSAALGSGLAVREPRQDERQILGEQLNVASEGFADHIQMMARLLALVTDLLAELSLHTSELHAVPLTLDGQEFVCASCVQRCGCSCNRPSAPASMSVRSMRIFRCRTARQSFWKSS